MNQKSQALLQVILATILLGGTTLFPKLIDLPVPSIILGRSIIAFLVILLFLLITRGAVKLKSMKEGTIVVVVSLLMAAHWLTYFHSIKISTVTIAAISLHTYPIITVFLEPLFFRERLQRSDIAIAILALIGIILIVPKGDESNHITQGILFGVASAALFSLRNILNRKHLSHYSGATSMFYQLLIIILVLIPGADMATFKTDSQSLIYLLLLGTIFTALPHSLFANGLRRLKAKTVGILACTQPFYAMVFAVVFLKEIPTIKTAIGGAIIILCAIYESMNHHKEKTTQKKREKNQHNFSFSLLTKKNRRTRLGASVDH